MSRPYDFTTPIPNILGDVDKLQAVNALRGQQQAQQLNALAIQAQQGDLEAQRAYRNVLANLPQDPTERYNALVGTGNPEAISLAGSEQARALQGRQLDLTEDELRQKGQELLSKRMLEAIQVASARPMEQRLAVFQTYLGDTPLASLFDEDTEMTDEALAKQQTQLLGPMEVTAGASLMGRGGEVIGTAPKTYSPQDMTLDERLAELYRLRDTVGLTPEQEADLRGIEDAKLLTARQYGLTEVYDPTRDVNILQPKAPGLELPPEPTAGSRDRKEARQQIVPQLDVMQRLSSRIITRVGPEQRATAIARGTSAFLGNDPEFKAYDDAAFAMAGNLAVMQQGSRPSDADIKAIWVPLVPNPYRDTSESAEIKWSIIRAMANLPPRNDLNNTEAARNFVREVMQNSGLDPETGLPGDPSDIGFRPD